jgi:hypothetical protein
MAWKGLFQHLERLFINDYHEFKCANDVHIEEWWLYWLPNYVSITKGFLAIRGMVINLNSNVTSGSGSSNGSGTMGSGGTKPSTSAWGPLLAFNLVVEFFHELQWNYQGVRIVKMQKLHDFQCKPHESL